MYRLKASTKENCEEPRGACQYATFQFPKYSMELIVALTDSQFEILYYVNENLLWITDYALHKLPKDSAFPFHCACSR